MAITYLHVTVAGADTKDGSTWAKAMDMATFRDYLQDTVAADTIFYVKSGTYTFGETTTAKNVGTATTPVRIIGVLTGTTNEGANVVLSDHAFTTNRPVFAMETYVFTTSDYYKVSNIIFTMTDANINPVVIGQYNVIFNCKSTNNSTTANKLAFSLNTYSVLVACEAISTNGYAINPIAAGCAIINCYAHDSVRAINLGQNRITIQGCILDTCTVGIAATAYTFFAINNTIYACTTGITTTTVSSCLIINNIISQCTTGVSTSSGEGILNLYKNNLLNNTTNGSNVTFDSSNIVVDVGTTVLTDAANADFTLKAADMTARSKGLMVGVNQGTADKAFHVNIGADQTGDFPAAATTLESDSTDGVQGTYHAPSVGEVIDTAVFGAASAVSGTFAIPAESDVKDTVQYGAGGTEFTGSYVGGGGIFGPRIRIGH